MKTPTLTKLNSLQFLQLTRFACLILISAFLVRKVSTELVGTYETLLLYGALFTTFWVTGFINSFIPYYYHSDAKEAKILTFNIFLLISGCSTIVIIALIPFFFIFKFAQADLFILFFVANLFIAPSYFSEYILLVNNRSKSIAFYGLASNILQAAAVIVPLYYDNTLHLSLWGLIVNGVARYLFMLNLVIKFGIIKIDKKLLYLFARKSFPYLLSLIVASTMAQTDSILIKFFFSNPDFAVFRYGAREFPITLLMASAFSNMQSGEIALHAKQNLLPASLTNIKKGSARLMHILFPATIVLMIFSRSLFVNFYSDSFQYSAFIFNIYLLLIIGRLLFPQTILIGLQKNKTLFRLSVYEWVINIIADIVFLKLWGMAGIAAATVLALLSERFLLFYQCRKEGIKFSDIVPVKVWVWYGVLTITAFVIITLWEK